MDDEAIGGDQARRLRAALSAAELELGRVWMHYFRLGGEVSEMEIDAYLHHALALPALQRDLLAQALSELTDGHRIPPVPFTADYHAPGSAPRSLERDECPHPNLENRDEEDQDGQER